MIAAICTWHEHHEAAVTEIELRLGRGETTRAATPTLVETYAVLTPLPSPYRLTSADALSLVEANSSVQAPSSHLTGRRMPTFCTIVGTMAFVADRHMTQSSANVHCKRKRQLC
jgi:hypothetical protein